MPSRPVRYLIPRPGVILRVAGAESSKPRWERNRGVAKPPPRPPNPHAIPGIVPGLRSDLRRPPRRLPAGAEELPIPPDRLAQRLVQLVPRPPAEHRPGLRRRQVLVRDLVPR